MIDWQIISTAVILSGLVITTAFVVLIPDWRLAAFALVAQYITAAALLVQAVPPQLVGVRVLSGAWAILILYITLRQKTKTWRRAEEAAQDDATLEQLQRQPIFIVSFPFRLFALALVAVGIIGIASSMSFLGLTPDVLFGGLWLTTAGVLVAILSRDVVRLGMGILLFTSGFTILETATEASLLLFGLLNIADLLLALVIAHLSALPTPANLAQRRRGEGG